MGGGGKARQSGKWCEGLIRGGHTEGLISNVPFRRDPKGRFGGVFEFPNLFANLAHTTAGVAVGRIDDPVMGTSGIDESG